MNKMINVECVEIYIPKRAEYISPLYDYLYNALNTRIGTLSLQGYSRKNQTIMSEMLIQT